MRLSSPVIRGLEYTALPFLCNFLFSLSLTLSFSLSPLSHSLIPSPSPFIPSTSRVFYSLLSDWTPRADAPRFCICILLNVVNLSKRGPLCAGSQAVLLASNVCGILRRVHERQSTGEIEKGYLPRRYSERIDGRVHLTEINVLISLSRLEDDMLMS